MVLRNCIKLRDKNIDLQLHSMKCDIQLSGQ